MHVEPGIEKAKNLERETVNRREHFADLARESDQPFLRQVRQNMLEIGPIDPIEHGVGMPGDGVILTQMEKMQDRHPRCDQTIDRHFLLRWRDAALIKPQEQRRRPAYERHLVIGVG